MIKYLFAYLYTRFAYRDTFIEDLHCEKKCLTIADNTRMKAVLTKNIRNVNRMVAEMSRIERIAPGEGFKALNAITSERIEWDEPEKIDSVFEGAVTDLAAVADYVLAGAFATGCREGWTLDNKTMKVLNKDIHNRFYTLIKEYGFVE